MKNLPSINYDEALELLNRAVQEKGENYVYPSNHCVYFCDNEPACIVGHVLAYKGVTYDDVANVNSVGVGGLDIGADHTAAVLLSQAQAAQDEHVPWGLAVERAIGYIETYCRYEDAA